MKCILGKKLEMTQIFRESGEVIPVTRIQAGPCVVTQVKTKARDGVDSLQLGFGTQKTFRITKAVQGHLKGLASVRFMRDVRSGDEAGLSRGDVITVKVFSPGEKVQVVGTSKGKGFQGVVKRHGFAGHPSSHGHKDQSRMPGSIGAGGVQRVFKGMRMGGHMGDTRVTIKNLEIVEINPEDNTLLIKGAVPGARGALLVLSTSQGVMEMDVEKTETPVEETSVVAEEAPVEVAVTSEAASVEHVAA